MAITPEQARAELARRRARSGEPAQSAPPVDPNDGERLGAGAGYLRGLANSVTQTYGDELAGGVAGVAETMRRGQWSPFTGILPGIQSGTFQQAYNQQAQRSRDNYREAVRDQPLATGAGEVTGYMVPGLGIGRAARTGVNLVGRLGRAGATGATFGAFSGFGSGETMPERLEGAAEGGALGLVLGAGVHGVLGEALPSLLRSGRRMVGLPAESGRVGVAERTANDLLRAARQNERLNVESLSDVGGVIRDAAVRDPSLTVAEALGRSAINRVVKYSRLPGRTAERAEQTLERNASAFDELTSRLDDTLTPRAQDGSPLTMRDASGELDAAFNRTSIDGYQQALARPIPTELANSLQTVIRRHPEFYQRAIQEAQKIARGEGITGLQGITDPRLWHYLKVGASDTLRSMRREGLGATLARQYTQSIRALTDNLDNIPGYRGARQQWGSLSEAREALEAGFGFDRLRPDEIEQLSRRLTPFQRRYLQAGVTERVRDVLERRDNDGLVNIARELTNRRRGALLRAAFGDKRGAIDDFLEYARLRRQMHNDARRMASSQESPTGIVTGEGLADAIPTGAISLRAMAMRSALDSTVGRIGERNRDILGRILLTPVGDFEPVGRGLISRVQREQRRRLSRRRLERTRQAYIAGTGGIGVYEGANQE